MKKFAQVTCMVINLEVLYDGPIFLGIARCQGKGSIFCKHRRTEEAKTKVHIFVYKIFTNSALNSYTAIAKVKSLQIEAIVKFNNICTGNISLGHCTNIANSAALRPRAILPSAHSKKQLLLYYYEMFLGNSHF